MSRTGTFVARRSTIVRRFAAGRALAAFVALGVTVAMAPPASAVEGVIQINQARALAGGVTPGDAPGFPVRITRSGSYRLTGNLDISGQQTPENLGAIEIMVAHVTLDLNGFSVIGPTVCTGSPVTSCAPQGTGIGIGAGPGSITVLNGMVRGFGATGLYIGSGRVDGVQAFSNNGLGIWLGAGGEVVNSAAIGNGNTGIYGVGIVVRASRSLDNAGLGIGAEPGEVRDSEAVHNVSSGISVPNGLALQNISRDNGFCGISAGGGALGRNVINGTTTICGGTQFGTNLCNFAVCP